MAWTIKRTTKSGRTRYTGCYRDDLGRKRSAGTAPTKRRALALAADEEARLRHGQWVAPETGLVTFGEYFTDEWLPNRDLEVRSQEFYANIFRTALQPAFGSLALREITAGRIQGWIAAQRRAGDNPHTIRHRFMTLQTVLAGKKGGSAIRDGHLQANSCEGVSTPIVPRRAVTVYTPEQSDEAIRCLDPWWTELVLVLTETGCRWGEVQGLCVGDVWAGNAVIRRTIVETTTSLSGNGTRFITKEYPKNRKPRRLAISPGLSTAVEQMVTRRGLQPGDRLFAREGLERNRGQSMRSKVWPNGVPVSRSHFRRVWSRTCHSAGVPDLRVHDLRASNISWLIAGGADLATVMQRAGHSQLATTQRYVTALDDADDRALTALTALRARRQATNDPRAGEH